MHLMRSIFDEKETEAILLVDASNAFNSLNRKCSLLNIRQLCPAISTVLISTYRDSTDLFLGSDTILSEEGTTQGDPLAMPFYALATRPLIGALRLSNNSIRQTWYADDATAAGSISALKEWWQDLCKLGPAYGYFVNAKKTLACHKRRTSFS